jgi:hypothetical protein
MASAHDAAARLQLDIVGGGSGSKIGARSCGARRAPPFCLNKRSPPHFQRTRDITCDGSVMAEVAENCRCDGVMDRIAFVFFL